MKTPITIFAVLLGIFTVYSQDPTIIWQKTIGGSNEDYISAFEATADGDNILAGNSRSNISGDKTEDSNGQSDLWIVKTDSTGNIEWQNTIGGSDNDGYPSIKQTSDGGYILATNSISNISGDKTENNKGYSDYWIIKLDSSGEILWQKTYGGDQVESEPKIVETSDGGYFVGGSSKSGVSGDKTEASNGDYDFWVLKLDGNGNLLWQNTIGGSNSDNLTTLLQTSDGGYMLGGNSSSNIGGDKSENSRGGSDYWVVKLNSSGNIQWEKTIGGELADGLESIIATTDGNYLLTGQSGSYQMGDKTVTNYGIIDYWILKIDASGNILWQQGLGGYHIDKAYNAVELGDGSYLIAGSSESNTNGNKTDDSHGQDDYWLVRLGVSGNIISQKSIGGASYERKPFILLRSNGNYLMACTSTSNISGDKGENSKGREDYWIFETTSGILGMESNTSEPTFNAYPNPNSGLFTINLGKEYTDLTVQILNTLGQVISSENYVSARTIQQEINASAGIYFVKISTAKEGSNTLRIIKQ